MTPERWQRVEEVLQAALDLPEAERPAHLAAVCCDDIELQQEAVSLLDAHEHAGDFLEHPAIEQDANVLLGDGEPDRLADEVGPYQIIRRLGRGGMGEVYLAQDRRLGRMVALKVLPPYFVSDDARLRRFQTEARAASALNHPNILTIYEVGQTEDIHFIATEYIEGQTIRELIRNGRLTLAEVFDIGIQLIAGLSVAHAAGIIHRDIKPENIMRRDDSVMKILDFGIAKLLESPTAQDSTWTTSIPNQTETGALMGTIGYISPEQVRGLPVDQRTDIWSCGVVLYEMLTGKRPFAGTTNADTIVAILESTPAPLFAGVTHSAILVRAQQVIDKALSKHADERYETTAEMLADLNAIKNELEVASVDRKVLVIRSQTMVSQVQTIVDQRGLARRRSRFLFATVAVSLMLLVIGTVLYRRFGVGPPKNAPPAATVQKVYTKMSEAGQLRFVNEQEQRISALMGERPAKLNDEALRAIKAQIDRHLDSKTATLNPERESLATVYRRAPPYIPVIAKAFAERRIPVVIGIYLPMLESAYQPCYENSIGAKGLFQFLPQTSQHYGVARDEMCDVNKMAPAAAHYIADRMAELGSDSQSMTLVLLSYNQGPNAVLDGLRRLREADSNFERNYWTLFANRDKLDESFRQSAGYVPGFFALAIIGENPEAFELGMPPLSSLANDALSTH
jgi:serine/threonine protein kinase